MAWRAAGALLIAVALVACRGSEQLTATRDAPPAIRIDRRDAMKSLVPTIDAWPLPASSADVRGISAQAIGAPPPARCWPEDGACVWKFEVFFHTEGAVARALGTCDVHAITGIAKCSESGRPPRVVGTAIPGGTDASP